MPVETKCANILCAVWLSCSTQTKKGDAWIQILISTSQNFFLFPKMPAIFQKHKSGRGNSSRRSLQNKNLNGFYTILKRNNEQRKSIDLLIVTPQQNMDAVFSTRTDPDTIRVSAGSFILPESIVLCTSPKWSPSGSSSMFLPSTGETRGRQKKECTVRTCWEKQKQKKNSIV